MSSILCYNNFNLYNQDLLGRCIKIKIKVKINEVAKAYGITLKGLHYYKSRGVIKPNKSESNNYMLLDIEDIYSIFRCKAYQKFGFTLKEIANIGTKYNLDQMKSILESKLGKLEQEIINKQISAEMISGQLRCIELIDDYYNQCSIQDGEGIYYITFLSINENNDGNSLIIDSNSIELAREWINYAPSAASFKLYNGMTDDVSITKGLTVKIGYYISERYSDYFPIKNQPCVKYIPPQKYVFTIVKGPYGSVELEKKFEHVSVYFKENKLKLTGNPFAIMITSVYEEGHDQQYEMAWFPFTPEA